MKTNKIYLVTFIFQKANHELQVQNFFQSSQGEESAIREALTHDTSITLLLDGFWIVKAHSEKVSPWIAFQNLDDEDFQKDFQDLIAKHYPSLCD